MVSVPATLQSRSEPDRDGIRKAQGLDRNRAIGTACLTLASCSRTRV
jgi:hypothetical protein